MVAILDTHFCGNDVVKASNLYQKPYFQTRILSLYAVHFLEVLVIYRCLLFTLATMLRTLSSHITREGAVISMS